MHSMHIPNQPASQRVRVTTGLHERLTPSHELDKDLCPTDRDDRNDSVRQKGWSLIHFWTVTEIEDDPVQGGKSRTTLRLHKKKHNPILTLELGYGDLRNIEHERRCWCLPTIIYICYEYKDKGAWGKRCVDVEERERDQLKKQTNGEIGSGHELCI